MKNKEEEPVFYTMSQIRNLGEEDNDEELLNFLFDFNPKDIVTLMIFYYTGKDLYTNRFRLADKSIIERKKDLIKGMELTYQELLLDYNISKVDYSMIEKLCITRHDLSIQYLEEIKEEWEKCCNDQT